MIVASEQRREIAQKIADMLFVNGDGKQADQLRLVQNVQGRRVYLGGWSRRAAVDRIVELLEGADR